MINTIKKPFNFIITPHITAKLAELERGLGLKFFCIQREDFYICPYGLNDRPYNTIDQAEDALEMYKSANPSLSYVLTENGIDSDYCLINNNWQESVTKAKPFMRAWLFQTITDTLISSTFSEQAVLQDFHDASEAAFATADAIEFLLGYFPPELHAFRDSSRYYKLQGEVLSKVDCRMAGNSGLVEGI